MIIVELDGVEFHFPSADTADGEVVSPRSIPTGAKEYTRQLGRLGEMPKRISEAEFERAIASLGTLSNIVHRNIADNKDDDIRRAPDKVSVEFSVQINGDLSVGIASASRSSAFKVTFEWAQAQISGE